MAETEREVIWPIVHGVTGDPVVVRCVDRCKVSMIEVESLLERHLRSSTSSVFPTAYPNRVWSQLNANARRERGRGGGDSSRLRGVTGGKTEHRNDVGGMEPPMTPVTPD